MWGRWSTGRSPDCERLPASSGPWAAGHERQDWRHYVTLWGDPRWKSQSKNSRSTLNCYAINCELHHVCSKTWLYVKEKPQDMKSLLDFLDQNKDLLETLGPEVDKLKEMQAKVDQHEEQINHLTGRVYHLEKVTYGNKNIEENNAINIDS